MPLKGDIGLRKDMQQLQYHLSAITHGLMNGNSKRLHKGNKKYSLTAKPKSKFMGIIIP